MREGHKHFQFIFLNCPTLNIIYGDFSSYELLLINNLYMKFLDARKFFLAIFHRPIWPFIFALATQICEILSGTQDQC